MLRGFKVILLVASLLFSALCWSSSRALADAGEYTLGVGASNRFNLEQYRLGAVGMLAYGLGEALDLRYLAVFEYQLAAKDSSIESPFCVSSVLGVFKSLDIWTYAPGIFLGVATKMFKTTTPELWAQLEIRRYFSLHTALASDIGIIYEPDLDQFSYSFYLSWLFL